MHEIADIACNFTSERFNKDLDEVIKRAIANKITKFGLICSRMSDLNKLLKIYKQYSKNMKNRFLTKTQFFIQKQRI